MKRDIRKALDYYKEHFTEAFYAGDIFQIKELAREEAEKEGNPGAALVSAIYTALRVGYVVGYRRAKKDAKKAK